MQRITTIIAVCLIGIIVVLDIACTQSLKISCDYDHSTTFSKYTTFNISKVQGSFNEFNRERITRAIRNEFQKKGYTEKQVDGDFRVIAIGTSKDRLTINANTSFQNGGLHRYGYWATPALTTINTTEYKEGTFVIDVVDARTNKLVWEAIGTAELHRQPKNAEKAISKVITQMLRAFPANN